jgi:hypothetical protein
MLPHERLYCIEHSRVNHQNEVGVCDIRDPFVDSDSAKRKSTPVVPSSLTPVRRDCQDDAILIRSAMDTSYAKDFASIFSITLCPGTSLNSRKRIEIQSLRDISLAGGSLKTRSSADSSSRAQNG